MLILNRSIWTPKIKCTHHFYKSRLPHRAIYIDYYRCSIWRGDIFEINAKYIKLFMKDFIKLSLMSMLQRWFYKDRLCWCIDYYGYYNHPSLKNCHFYWIIFTFEYLSLPPLNTPLSSCHASLSFRFSFLSKTLTPPMPTPRFQFPQFLLSSQLFSQFLFSLLFFLAENRTRWRKRKRDLQISRRH